MVTAIRALAGRGGLAPLSTTHPNPPSVASCVSLPLARNNATIPDLETDRDVAECLSPTCDATVRRGVREARLSTQRLPTNTHTNN